MKEQYKLEEDKMIEQVLLFKFTCNWSNKQQTYDFGSKISNTESNINMRPERFIIYIYIF